MRDVHTISTDELRFQFSKVLAAMKKGQSLTLTYRNKPLARIEPVRPEIVEVSESDPFFHLGDFAEPMGRISTDEIDEIVYSS